MCDVLAKYAKQLRSCAAITLASVISFVNGAWAAEPSRGEKLFALKLDRLFAEKCVSCHGGDPKEIAGGLDMRSRDSLLKGGESFKKQVLKPDHGTDSYLYRVTTRTIEGYEMPPKEAEKLSQQETWWIRDWINAGAPWPNDERIEEIQRRYAEGEQVTTSGGLSDDWTNRRYQTQDLWAYRPLKFTKPPENSHPIDFFINRRLRQLQLTPAAPAMPHELQRRLSFGLTGLPPANNREQDKPSTRITDHAEAIDQLMSTPHYGEHFGRLWLDVARYADSAGFANDYARPNAWRYRDYVIRAFNNDKPYADFVREQIAGDEISGTPETRIATGFLRMGPWEQTGMSVFRITRQQWLDDVTDSVGQTFLGHALQCAKCHDHKFDPVPTQDYYRMMAVFSTTQFAEPNTPFLPTENKQGFAQADTWTKAKIDGYVKQRNDLRARVESQKQKETGDAKVGDNGLDPGDENSLARMSKNISRHKWELEKTQPIALAVYTGKTIQRNNVSSRLFLPKNPWGKGRMEPDTILTGGDAYSRGAPVTPGAISAAIHLGKMQQREFPTGQGKRRLALANWIVDPKNPLAARVMVNRVWSWHFGRGLAGNPNNVGATGKHPTHPELLDFLADWFIRHDGSVKQLNRLILTSDAYQRSSRHPSPDSLAKLDPLGESYAVFPTRRLAAEELRDAMLAVSGELNRAVGGLPCRPNINREVAFQPRQIMGGTASVYEPDPTPQQRNRRTVYAEKIRGLRDPFLETFNQPGPDKSCELRETSTVAPQALTLLNAAEVQARSLAFAQRLMAEARTQQTDPAGATPLADVAKSTVIRRAFQLALQRPPSAGEQTACLDRWREAAKNERDKKHAPQRFETEVSRTVMAEKTGEPYTFIEYLPAYADYQPDVQPSDLDAETRGLARICLVLFNLNEFSYLD